MFWNPFVDSENINVAVEDGIATLTGTAASLNEYELAAQVAFEGGAQKVINRLNVNYGPEDFISKVDSR